MLQELLNCNEVSIYCFINEKDKKIYINSSIETIPSVLFQLKALKSILTEDSHKVVFKIIETYKRRHPLYLKWRVNRLYHKYKRNGYRTYIPHSYLKWRLYMRVGIPTGSHPLSQPKAIVKLKTSANVVHVIQTFDKVEDAKEYIKNNTISSIVGALVY